MKFIIWFQFVLQRVTAYYYVVGFKDGTQSFYLKDYLVNKGVNKNFPFK